VKYLIGSDSVTGYLLPVVFPEEFIHVKVAKAVRSGTVSIRSAGFVYLDGDKWKVSDKVSESLRLGPDPGDELILHLFLRAGLVGLDLHNYMALLDIQARKGV
jgi:hypothetical protein